MRAERARKCGRYRSGAACAALSVGVWLAAWLGGCAAAPKPQADRLPASAAVAPRSALEADEQGLYEHAWSLVEAGRYAEAEEAYRSWLSVHGRISRARTPKAMFWLGYCQEKLGRTETALRSYDELREKFPADEAARRAQVRSAALRVP